MSNKVYYNNKNANFQSITKNNFDYCFEYCLKIYYIRTLFSLNDEQAGNILNDE